jgi:hypothetical protein
MANNSETLIKIRQPVYRHSKTRTMMIFPELILRLLASNHHAVLMAVQAASLGSV